MTRANTVNPGGETRISDQGTARFHRARRTRFSHILEKQTRYRTCNTVSPCRGEFEGLQAEKKESTNERFVSLGAISRRNPTVSDLLIKHPIYGKECWRIIHSALNRHKPYTEIRAGTTIYLHPGTGEILWDQKEECAERKAPVSQKDSLPSEAECDVPGNTDFLSARLVKAVKPYLGMPYQEIDCYGLLIEGLKNLGIRYRGHGGLREQLVKMALQKGRPRNAYLNGEGLIRAAGSRIYYKRALRIPNAETQARRTFEEVRPLLQEGLILSFSTPTRGHTGVVSLKDRAWTFINSGRLDHPVGISYASKGVGEELLREEIRNWFVLAAKRQEPLRITLGRLTGEKLAAFLHDRRLWSEKV